MFAALITGKGQVEIQEFPDPTPNADGVVVDVAYCGICGTDVHAYQSGKPYNPAVCGHEWTGAVSAVGADVQGFSEGDRVVVAVPWACGRCEPCRAGQSDRCTYVFLHALGRNADAPKHGGFAPKIAVGAGRVMKTDPRLSDLQAAQVEPATITFHAVRRTTVRLGDIAVVQGAGPIGLLTLQWARAAGAGEVIVVEPNAARRELALTLGATAAVAPGEEGKTAVLERSRGLGADVVFECAGVPATVQSAVDLARRGGAMTLIGLADSDAQINPTTWLMKEIRVTSALAYLHEEFAMCMGMIADGRVQVEPMHSSTVGLSGLSAALADLGSGASPQHKVLVDPRVP